MSLPTPKSHSDPLLLPTHPPPHNHAHTYTTAGDGQIQAPTGVVSQIGQSPRSWCAGTFPRTASSLPLPLSFHNSHKSRRWSTSGSYWLASITNSRRTTSGPYWCRLPDLYTSPTPLPQFNTSLIRHEADGQVQGPTGSPVGQISDGQIQATTGSPVSQIGSPPIPDVPPPPKINISLTPLSRWPATSRNRCPSFSNS